MFRSATPWFRQRKISVSLHFKGLLLSALLPIGCLGATTPSNGNSPNTTVFIGDSIVAFGNAPETGESQSFGWGWTAQAVFLSGGKIQQLYNAGVPGQTTARMVTRFATDVIAYSPGAVVIMGGTNDATTAGTLMTTSQVEATTANLKAMIDEAKQAGIQPILCTLPPRGDGTNYNQNTQMINAAIHKLSQAERIVLVDFFSILVDPTTGVYRTGYDNGDGIHPSASACKAMAQFFITATQNLYGPAQESIVDTTGDATNLIPNPLFLTSDTAWTGNNAGNNYGTAPAPTYSEVSGGTSISGNWFTFVQPPASGAGQYYAVNGPTIIVTPGHHLAYSFKFVISGLQANGGHLNMGYAYGAQNFTYGYLTDATGTFYIEFNAPSTGTFTPGFFIYPNVGTQSITVQIAQISLVDLSAVGY